MNNILCLPSALLVIMTNLADHFFLPNRLESIVVFCHFSRRCIQLERLVWNNNNHTSGIFSNDINIENSNALKEIIMAGSILFLPLKTRIKCLIQSIFLTHSYFINVTIRFFTMFLFMVLNT